MQFDLPRIIQAATLAAPVLVPELRALIQQFMAQHPDIAMWIVGAAMFLHALREPLVPKKVEESKVEEI